MTITTYSNQLNQTAPGSPQLYGPVQANWVHGKKRMAAFSLTLSAQAIASNLALAVIPKGARIIGGVITASATLANAAQISVGLAAKDGTTNIKDAGITALTTAGVSSSAAEAEGVALLKAAAVQGAAQVPFALTQALGYLYETQKEVLLTVTTSVGAVTTEVITGHVEYVVE